MGWILGTIIFVVLLSAGFIGMAAVAFYIAGNYQTG